MSLTVEESNFLRFYYLNLKVATKAVRVYFDHIHRQGRLEWKLKKNKTHLKSLDNLITSHQINIVYPSSGHIVNSDQFDTTLMICLLRNMKPYTVEYANDKGWDKFPPATDASYLADLARVKWYRNFVSHHKGELTAADFNLHCRNLEPAIGRLGGPILLIEAQSAQHVILDTSLKDMLLELRNCEKSQQEMTDKINSHQSAIHKIEAETQKLTTKLSDYKGTIDACTKEIETCKNDIKKNKEIMKELQNQSDKKQNEIENLITLIGKLEIEYEQHDKMLKEHGEHLVMHDGQMIQHQEHLVMHDGQLEKCENQIHDIKEKQQNTYVTSVRSKQKRLEDDIQALMEEDEREGTFVTTKSVADGLALLKQNGVLLITGHAGTGKSRISRHVLHMFCTDDSSYKCIKLDTLEEWKDMVHRDENVAVLIDDIFGETNCIYNREKAISDLDKVHSYVRKGNIKFIMTIRDTVKRQCQEVFDSHRLFQYELIDLSSDKYLLSREEKHTFLTKYMKSVHLSVYDDKKGFLDSHGDLILKNGEVSKITWENPVKGFPLVVYQFVHNDKYFKLGSTFFDRPTEAMLEEMNAIRRKGVDQRKFTIQYAVMVYTAINENCIDPEDNLCVTEITNIIDAIYEKTIHIKTIHILDAVKELKGSHFINIPNQTTYRLQHQTLLESVILSFARIDKNYLNKIIPFISWSFFLKMIKPESYREKVGEVVLRIPTNSYEILADRLVDIYMAQLGTLGSDIFMHNLCLTDIFQHKYCHLLPYLLKSLEKEDNKNLHMENMIRSSEMKNFEGYLLQMKNNGMFLVNLLRTRMTLLCIEDIQNDNMHYSVLKTFKTIIKTSSNVFIIDIMKRALIDSLYKICSTKDVRCVKATLDIIEENKIPVLLDQGVRITNEKTITPNVHGNSDTYVLLTLCIWKAYAVFSKPVLEVLLLRYNQTLFDINIFFKMIYKDEWIQREIFSVMKEPSSSFESLKWMIGTFQDQKLDDPNFILRTASKYQMFDTVEYVASKCKTFDVVSCLQAFADKGDKCLYIEIPFKQELFNFLIKRVEITSKDLIPVVMSVIQKHDVPNYMFDAFLPVCLNNTDILTLACNTGKFYLVNHIVESSQVEHLDIQSALMAACKKKERRFEYFRLCRNEPGVEGEQIKIVKYIADKFKLEQFDLKVACQLACSSKKFTIVEWFIQNIETTRLDVYTIIHSALVDDRSNILERLMKKIEIESLDKRAVLTSVTEHYTDGCSTTILEIVRSIWCSTVDKGELQMEEIVNIGYERKCCELLKWIHENCHPHISIDSKKVLMLACEDYRVDVAEWVVQAFEQVLWDIDGGELFMLACRKTSDLRYEMRQINWIKMVNWILTSFQIKVSGIISGVLKLISANREIRNKISSLVLSILEKYMSCLGTEDINVMINKSLEHEYYAVVNWFIKKRSSCTFDKQMILNKSCRDNEIKTIKMLRKSFYALDMNQAIINVFDLPSSRSDTFAFKERCFNYDLSVACLNLLWNEVKKNNYDSIDIRTIVNTVCMKTKVSNNIMTWILLNLPLDQSLMNEVFISCCKQSKIHHVKYIVHEVDNEQIDIKKAFVQTCRAGSCRVMFQQDHDVRNIFHVGDFIQMKNDDPNLVMIVDYLFQMQNDKDSYVSLVVNEISKNRMFELILYFLEAGYSGDTEMKTLLKEACRHGYVRLVQWILANVGHEKLDVKSAFIVAYRGTNRKNHANNVMCLALIWHYIHDKHMFDIDTVLNTLKESQSNTFDSDSEVSLKTWLLYIENMLKSDNALLKATENIN